MRKKAKLLLHKLNAIASTNFNNLNLKSENYLKSNQLCNFRLILISCLRNFN